MLMIEANRKPFSTAVLLRISLLFFSHNTVGLALAFEDFADSGSERLSDGAVHDEVHRRVDHQKQVVEARKGLRVAS